jgi:hypothetical protein
MKIRLGFISNSSTTSFILDGTKYSASLIREVIENVLKAVSLIDKEEFIVDDICEIYERSSGQEFLNQIKGFYEGMNHDYYDEEIKYLDKGQFDKPAIIVDSTFSNSIPWPVQEFLEGIAIKRQHWG